MELLSLQGSWLLFWYYSKEPKGMTIFDFCTFFHTDFIKSEARILVIVVKWHHRANGLLQQGAQKCDRFWFMHILSCRFNPIRSQDSHCSNKMTSSCKWPITALSPKVWPIWFIHILSYRFNPIRSQLETVLHIWLVNVCMKECELNKGGRTIGLLAVSKISNSIKQHFVVKVWLSSVEKSVSSTSVCK